MNRRSKIAGSVVSAVSLALATAAEAQKHPEKPTYRFEKCYGIAKAGRNDCFTPRNSCGGTSGEDGQKDAWIYLPAGTCDRIVGGIRDKRSGQDEKDNEKPSNEKQDISGND